MGRALRTTSQFSGGMKQNGVWAVLKTPTSLAMGRSSVSCRKVRRFSVNDGALILTPTPLQILERGAQSLQRCPRHGATLTPALSPSRSSGRSLFREREPDVGLKAGFAGALAGFVRVMISKEVVVRPIGWFRRAEQGEGVRCVFQTRPKRELAPLHPFRSGRWANPL